MQYDPRPEARAVARPIPEAAPVTRAAFLVSGIQVLPEEVLYSRETYRRSIGDVFSSTAAPMPHYGSPRRALVEVVSVEKPVAETLHKTQSDIVPVRRQSCVE